MANLPYQPEGENSQAPYHIVPDPIKGGWNLYDTHQPQEPQKHFASKEDAIAYAEKISGAEGTGFIVEESEAPRVGKL
jgi:hypothetical protein